MLRNFMGVVCSPLFQVDGGGAGSGSNTGGAGSTGGGKPQGGSGTGSGTQAQPNTGGGSGQPQQGSSNAGGAGASEPLEWDENRLYRVPGRKDPISGKDYIRGFQSQFTKASQEAAKLKKDIAARDQELQRIRNAATGGNTDPNANAGANMLGEIEAAPFIDGKTMGGVIRDFQNGIRERDMVQMAVLQKLKQIEGVLGELHGVNLNQNHQTKLKTWLEGVGLGDDQDAMELADIIYRGYEGDNLDQEFPQIFEQRWKQMQNAVQRQLAKKREQTRQLPWVPAKGGNAGPGKSQGLTGKETPKQLTDIFFNRYGGQADT